MPPTDRFVISFAAEPPQETLPYGRWASTLAEHFLGACREHDNRDFLGILGAFQRPGQFQTAHVGQHPVDQHQVRSNIDDARSRLPAVLGLANFIACPPQSKGNHVTDALFIFNDEDALGGHIVASPLNLLARYYIRAI